MHNNNIQLVTNGCTTPNNFSAFSTKFRVLLIQFQTLNRNLEREKLRFGEKFNAFLKLQTNSKKPLNVLELFKYFCK